nr:MAG TPA: hypothetical protein [Caudoviricetes sp.]
MTPETCTTSNTQGTDRDETANVAKPDRYYVSKASDSRYAFVMDRNSGSSVARFDVMRGGWEEADRYRDRLNRASADMEAR